MLSWIRSDRPYRHDRVKLRLDPINFDRFLGVWEGEFPQPGFAFGVLAFIRRDISKRWPGNRFPHHLLEGEPVPPSDFRGKMQIQNA